MYLLPRSDKKNQKGQALLIVLLVLAVSLTLVLSTASRSVTDIQTTTLEEDSLRAFNAAEAGVEESLLVGEIGTIEKDFTGSRSNFVAETVYYEPENGRDFVHPREIFSGEELTFWFVSHDGDGNLTCSGGADCLRGSTINVCWGEDGIGNASDQTPAVEISIYYDPSLSFAFGGNAAGVRVARVSYDGKPGRGNGFTTASRDCTIKIGGEDYKYEFETNPLSFNSEFGISIGGCANRRGCLLKASVRSLYNDAAANPVGISIGGAGGLPSQGFVIDSTGGAGDTARRIQVRQTYPELPSIFDAAVYSNGDLIK